jgi:HK97 gp10 family phage protein
MAKISRRANLLKKLAALPPAARSAIKQALAESADEIVAGQKRLVPKDSHDLENSIGSTFGGYKAENSNVRGVSAGSGGDPDLTVTIHAGNAKAFYAAFVEFGTSAYIAGGKFKGAHVPARPAQPFFYPAYRANKRRVKARITRATTRAAKQVAASS